jgi:hypothetical protein
MRRIKYMIQAKVPNLFGENLFSLGVQIDVDGDDVPPQKYIDLIMSELQRQLQDNFKKPILESQIVVLCLAMLDICEIKKESK